MEQDVQLNRTAKLILTFASVCEMMQDNIALNFHPQIPF